MDVVKRKGKEHEKLLISDDDAPQDKKKVSAWIWKLFFENYLCQSKRKQKLSFKCKTSANPHRFLWFFVGK